MSVEAWMQLNKTELRLTIKNHFGWNLSPALEKERLVNILMGQEQPTIEDNSPFADLRVATEYKITKRLEQIRLQLMKTCHLGCIRGGVKCCDVKMLTCFYILPPD